jgi:hypothetical protein
MQSTELAPSASHKFKFFWFLKKSKSGCNNFGSFTMFW